MEKDMRNQRQDESLFTRQPVQWKVALVKDEKLSMTIVFPETSSPEEVRTASPATLTE